MKKLLILILVFISITGIKAENMNGWENDELIPSESINEAIQKSSSENDPFDSILEMKGISVVYISKAMLGMMPNMVNMPGVNIGNVAGKLEAMYVISAESKKTAATLNQATDKLLKSGNYETLMMVKDDDSLVNFYMKINGNKNKNNSEILMVTKDDGEVSIIRFIGTFTLKDIQDLTKKNK